MITHTKISKKSLNFCKIGILILIWSGILIKIKEFIALAFIILLLSAILKIKKSPLIWIYSKIFDKKTKSKDKIKLNIRGIQFAHGLGATILGFCVILLYIIPKTGWTLTIIFGIIKIITSLGHCPVEKAYICITKKGGCYKLNHKIFK